MNKKLLSLGFAVPAVALLASAAWTPALAQGTMIVASYGGRTPEHWRQYVFEVFTKETGIKVEQVILPGRIVAGMQAQQEAKRVQWDISTSLAAGDFAVMSAQGWLTPIPDDVRAEMSKNYAFIAKDGIQSKRGALMIVCNKLTAKKCPTTAAEMLDTQNFPGTRFMPNFQPVEALTFAAYASGVAPDKVFPMDVDRAIGGLQKIRPSIAQFYDNSTTARQLLASGEVVMGLLWNGIPSQIKNDNSRNIDLQVSWDGAVTYSQFTAVYKGAPNEKNAWTFLKWLNAHPKELAAYASAEGSDTAHKQAFALLSNEIKEWSPEMERPVPTVEADIGWYMNAGANKTKIDDFWKRYLN
jgi:spermidine/putrescine-binding protein